MTFFIRNITLLVLSIVVLSCKGRIKDKNNSLTKQEVIEENNIPVPENGFSSGLMDKDGTIWFGSNGGGIYHFDGETVKNYTEKNGLSSNQVFSIVADHKNNLWFGTQNGLIKYNRKQFEHIPLPYQDTTSLGCSK